MSPGRGSLPGGRRRLVVVRGGGELGSAAARLLFLAGFRVVVLERAEPLAVRRLVCFAEAVWDGVADVEGVRAVRWSPASWHDAPPDDAVAVAVDPDAVGIAALSPFALVDARMTKSAPEPGRFAGLRLVGLGPGFVAGSNADLVVETQRGPSLGAVLTAGSALPDTAQPAPVAGETRARVLRAPGAGRFEGVAGIGDLVAAGEVVGCVGPVPVSSAIGGRLRGLLRSGVWIEAGVKLGDVDPRGAAVDAARISDKARAVAAGVIEAVLLDRWPGFVDKPETSPRQ